MVKIFYYQKTPKWEKKKAITEHRIRPGFGPLSLENICNLVIDSELPEAWYWNEEDVCKWLQHLGLHKYTEMFKRNHIVGNLLPVLSLKMLQDMKVSILDDAMTILYAICKLFDIRPEKRFRDPIQWPNVDPRRLYFWYRRNYENPPRLYTGKPLTMMEWMYENGYSSKHYRYSNTTYTRWDNNKYYNQLPFLIGRVVPNSQARLLVLNNDFRYNGPFKERPREDYLLWRELKRW